MQQLEIMFGGKGDEHDLLKQFNDKVSNYTKTFEDGLMAKAYGEVYDYDSMTFKDFDIKTLSKKIGTKAVNDLRKSYKK